MTFLGQVISKGKVSIDPSKIEVVVDWSRSTNVTEILSLLKLADYY